MSHAQMIAPAHPTEAAPLLRREFGLDGGHGAVERATLRTSALGVVEACGGPAEVRVTLGSVSDHGVECVDATVEHDPGSTRESTPDERGCHGVRLVLGKRFDDGAGEVGGLQRARVPAHE